MYWSAVARQHPAHDVAVHMQLPGDGAHAPLLHGVQPQDLRDQVRGYGHDASPGAASVDRDAGRDAGSPGARRPAAPRRSGSRPMTQRVLCLVRRAPPWWCPGSMRRCLGSMRPVEQRPPLAGNPGASRSVRAGHHDHRRRCAPRDAAASAETVRHAQGGHAMKTDNGARRHGEPHPETAASTAGCNGGCRGRSGCTARPARDSQRTGTGGLVAPQAPRRNRSAGRTRPSGPHCCGTAFIGTV